MSISKIKNDFNGTIDFTKIGPNTWTNVRKVKNLIKHLQKATKIITTQGEYSRIDWKSKYHDVLTHHCQNPKKSQILFNAFEQAFAEIPEGSDKDAIREFIRRNQIFIGLKKPHFNFSQSSISNLLNVHFKTQFDCFLTLVSERMNELYSHEKKVRDTNKKAVAILTCNAGGGHRMVAKSIEESLNQYALEEYDIKVINVDELPGDNIDLVTSGAVKTYQIFSQFRCQENNSYKADLFSDLKSELHHFIPVRTMHEVNCAIQGCGADIILNTIHHETIYLSTSSDIGLPINFINTDYELPPQLIELKKIADSDNFKVLTPIDYKTNIEGIVSVGYPIRAGFEQKISSLEKEEVKSKYKVGPNESLIIIQMGSLAMGIEEEIKKLINQTKNLKHKCHCVFLCASNEKVKAAIQHAQSNNNNPMISLHFEGMLDDSELSKLYQTCHAVLGKPGGSTTAEIAATGAFLLAYKPLPWELINLNYLADRKQGKEISSFKDLVHFLNSNRTLKQMPENEPLLNWKENIANEIDKVLKTSMHSENQITVKSPYSNSRLSHLFIRHCKKAFNSLKTLFTYILYLFQQLRNLSLPFLYARLKRWWKYN